MLSESFLRLRCGMLVWDVIKSCGGDFGCEPVSFRQADDQWDEVLLDLLLIELLADFVQGLDGLKEVSGDFAILC